MTGDLKTFELDLKKAADALQVGFGDALKKTVFDLDRGIVTRTPVDTGAAAGNWQATKGGEQPAFHEEPGFKGSQGAAESKSMESVAGLNFTDPYDIWWFSNFLPYIEVLEFGLYPGDGPKTVGGFSKQAPAGMVRVAIADAEIRVEDEIARALSARGF